MRYCALRKKWENEKKKRQEELNKLWEEETLEKDAVNSSYQTELAWSSLSTTARLLETSFTPSQFLTFTEPALPPKENKLKHAKPSEMHGKRSHKTVKKSSLLLDPLWKIDAFLMHAGYKGKLFCSGEQAFLIKKKLEGSTAEENQGTQVKRVVKK